MKKASIPLIKREWKLSLVIRILFQNSGLRPLEYGIRNDDQAGEEEQGFKTEVTSNLSTREWSEEVPHELRGLIIPEDTS